MGKQSILESVYNLAFEDELEKIAAATSVNYLYHYFDPKDVQSMLSKGGIITSGGGLGMGGGIFHPFISTTRQPKDSYFIKNKGMALGKENKNLVRFRLSKDKLKNKFRVKPIAVEGYDKIKGVGEFEERVYTAKGYKKVPPTTGVIPWKYVDGVEIQDRDGLKKLLRMDSKSIKPNIYDEFKGVRKPLRDTMRTLSKILKRVK